MKLYEELEKQLRKNPDFISENGELKKWVIISKAQNNDAALIGMLLESDELKKKFFIEVKASGKSALVFNQSMFAEFLEQKNHLKDSYTKYGNKVGLTIDGQYLKQRNEVALVWPYKDCVLEGGQSREEDKRDEIFFNELLAQDEITQLLEPKVLTNAMRYNEKGSKSFEGFRRDAELNRKRGLPEDTITDNLIIKGNNLLALHSLEKEFAGKVKLIYIDPPYNTGNDSFKYNDSFNHSTWLSYMKTRIQIARELLNNDSSIWINIDDDECHYLKVLMDEVFGRHNFIANVIWQKKYTTSNDATFFSDNHDHILVYAKNVEAFIINKLKRTEKMDKAYSNPDCHPKGNWKATPLHAKSGSTKAKPFSYTFKNGVTWTPPNGTFPRFSKEKLRELDLNDEIWFGMDSKAIPSKKTFLAEMDEYSLTPKTIFTYEEVGHNHEAKEELKKIFNDNIFATPKPERLMQRMIHLATRENDIVLDFFAGSGTTAAVAMKMNRQFITTEQMDYIDDVTIERIKKVISGEQGGISKAVNWQGGGEFVYLELKKYNEAFMERIESAKDTKELLKVWKDMKKKSFLNYNVDLKLHEKHIEEFKQLKLKDQKRHLAGLLDKNQLYVNLSSLNDKDFACSDEEKILTKDFYKIKK